MVGTLADRKAAKRVAARLLGHECAECRKAIVVWWMIWKCDFCGALLHNRCLSPHSCLVSGIRSFRGVGSFTGVPRPNTP